MNEERRPASTRNRTRRRARRVAFVLVGACLTYLVGANLALNTALLHPVLNKRPEKLLVRWESGWTLVPGIVHVTGLYIRGQSKKMQWQCRLSEGTFRIALLGLPFKEVRVRRGRGGAFEFHARQRLPPGAPVPPAARHLPEIEGLANPPDPAPEQIYPPRPAPRRPWRIDVANVRFDGGVDLWLYELRLRGEGTVGGGVVHQVRGPIEIHRAALNLEHAAVTVAGSELVRDVELDANVALSAFVPRQTRGLEILRHFQGNVRLENGRIVDLALLNAFLGQDGGLRMVAGEGRVALRLDVPAAQRAAGQLEILIEGAQLVAAETEVAGDVALRAELQHGDLVAGRFDLAGTTLALQHMTLPEPRRDGGEPVRRAETLANDGAEADAEDAGWWMQLQIDEGTVVVGRPLWIDTRVSFAMRDSRPLLTLFFGKPSGQDGELEVPLWARAIPNIRDIEGAAHLNLGSRGTIVDDIVITGDRMDLLARLKAQRQQVAGQLYVRYGVLHLGIDLTEGRKKIKLTRPKAWFIAQPEFLDTAELQPPS